MNRTLRNTLIIAAAVAIIGLIFAFIGFLTGGMKGVSIGPGGIKLAGVNDNSKAINETFTNISSIDADFDLRDVVLKKGDSFNVESKGVSEKFIMENDNGKLTLKDNYHTGFNFSLFNFFNDGEYSDIVITYPAGSAFENININSDSGSMKISDLSADKLILEDDLGDIELKNVKASVLDANIDSGSMKFENTNIAAMKFDLGLGDISAKGYTGGKINGSLDSGSADIQGSVTGPIDISNDLGDVELTLKGREDSYSYDLGTDLGDIDLNGQSSGGNISKTYENKPLIKIYTDSGSISIDFKAL